MSIIGYVIVSLLVHLSLCAPARTDGIHWSKCKQMVAKSTWHGYDEPLISLTSESLEHVSLRTTDNFVEYLYMQLGLLANYRGDIILSPNRDPKDEGFYFKINVWKDQVQLWTVEDSDWSQLAKVFTTTKLSNTQPAAIFLTVSNDTLELRHEVDGASFLTYHDGRFKNLEYFGFSSNFNDGEQATIYYDC